MSNSVRAVIYLGGTNSNSATTDTIEYVTIATTGNAADFGDLILMVLEKDALIPMVVLDK